MVAVCRYGGSRADGALGGVRVGGLGVVKLLERRCNALSSVDV